jgi:hypothetical protein
VQIGFQWPHYLTQTNELSFVHKEWPSLEMKKVVVDTYRLIFNNPMNQHKKMMLTFHSLEMTTSRNEECCNRVHSINTSANSFSITLHEPTLQQKHVLFTLECD